MHLHAFAFIAFTVTEALKFTGNDHLAERVGAVIAMAFGIYALKSFRAVFGGGWPITLAKAVGHRVRLPGRGRAGVCRHHLVGFVDLRSRSVMPKRFSRAVVDAADAAKIIGIKAGAKSDHKFTGVWPVVVNGRVYARSWTLKKDGWYRTFLEDRLGLLQVGDREIRVRADSRSQRAGARRGRGRLRRQVQHQGVAEICPRLSHGAAS